MTKDEYNKHYRKSHKGTIKQWVTKCYGRMKRDEKNKFKKELPFSKDEFYKWLDIDKLTLLLEIYTLSNYNKYLCPSIDRVDDYKDYNFDNMQLMTWDENDKKGRKSLKNKKQCGEMAKRLWSKRVIQSDKFGNFIASYYSTHEAQRQTGIDSSLIARACRRGCVAKGYRWHYE